ncbi:MAG: PKD domain-containing protein [Thermoplasmata archaeon]|nr:PKD domain-containing protein [Thermoplasmata archaeon]
MKGNKIIASLIVVGILLSTMVALNKLHINIIGEAGATTPGVDTWGNATINLEYGVSYSSVFINTSKWIGGGPFYLYYPTYRSGGTGGNANTFTWDGPYKVDGYSAQVTTAGINSAPLSTGGSAITFNRSGMWIFDNDGAHAGNDNTSYAGYIWVNTSTTYSIVSVPNFAYGAVGSIIITVNTETDTGCMIAIMDSDNSTVYHKWRATGVTEAIKIDGNFTLVGDYTVKAYRDFDAQNSTYYYPDENGDNFSMFYGSDYSGSFPAHPATTSENYNYANMGPWDPPEKNASDITFTVNTGEPCISLTNTTIYWGYKTRIDVNVTDNQGKGINVNKEAIRLKKGSIYTDAAYINNTGRDNYSIEIPRWYLGTPNGWKNLSDAVGANVNGTWNVVFGYDSNGDGTYEWNNSENFIVKSASPPVQLVIVNDGSGKPTDKKVNVPAYISGTGQAATILMTFDIFGRSITDEYRNAYYGDDADEDWNNITIEGDILYPVDATTLIYSGTEGRWSAAVTPTKPGGTLTITIDWPGDHNGTASQTIDIVNGTYATSAVDMFTIGADYNLTITVTDMDGDHVKNAHVYLMWQDVAYQFNDTSGTNTIGNGLNGEYTFWILPHKKDATTPDSAPQNITVAAQWYSQFWGYTKVIMEKNHNMQVTVTPSTAYAGDPATYDINVDLVGGGHPATTGLTVTLYNSTGALVTGDDAWSHAGAYSIIDEEIILSGGTFYLYASNDSCDSQGNNATLVITPYTICSSPSILAWKIDKAVNMSFQLTPPGNGTLRLNNMTSLPNASYPGQFTQITIENGIGTLDEVNATTLGNVTYAYIPDGGAERPAEGLLQIVPGIATPVPPTVYVGEVSTVTITVSHPATGVPIQDVLVTIQIPGIPGEYSQFTDINGKVVFTFFPVIIGEISIKIDHCLSGATIHIAGVNQPPDTPSNPIPVNGSSGVARNTDLSWVGGDPYGDPVTYDVYFGTITPPTTKVSANQSGVSYDPGAMEYTMQYFWRVVAWDNHGASASSPVWDFTTQEEPTGVPIANFTYTINDLTVSYDASVSSDTDGSIISYLWDFGDTEYGNGIVVNHTYAGYATYAVTLTVTDDDGNQNSLTVPISVLDFFLPEIVDYTPTIGYTGDSFTFNAAITDNDDVIYAFVHFWYDNGEENILFLNNVNGDTWEVPIYIENTLDSLNYFFAAIDSSYNFNSTEPKNIIILDNDNPSFIDYSPSSGTTGDSYIFDVAASDNIGVASVMVTWNHGSHGGVDIPLNNDGDGTWSLTIPLDDYLNPMSYTIKVTDTSNNMMIGSQQTVSVTDNDDPVIVDNTPSFAHAGDLFTFNATVTDNCYVIDVNVQYWFDDGSHTYAGMYNTGGDYWEWTTIDPINLTSVILQYNISAEDASGNSVSTGIITVPIGPDYSPNTPLTPSGPTSGEAGEVYSYTTSATDIDGDQVFYLFDWGDGTTSGWIGPYDSGTNGSASHTWAKGGYQIKAKAKDIHGVESDWSPSLPITMPLDLVSGNILLLKQVNQSPNAFPLQRQLQTR